MAEFLANFSKFIETFIQAIKDLVAQIRAINDGKGKEDTEE